MKDISQRKLAWRSENCVGALMIKIKKNNDATQINPLKHTKIMPDFGLGEIVPLAKQHLSTINACTAFMLYQLMPKSIFTPLLNAYLA